MEPQELPKNDHTEGSGSMKRRISSILKAPRKSARFPDPEQQENVVERAKPLDKRTSRRVSFAPANDVLLFSKDAKNTSPVRSPLQELMTATGAASQNRVQVDVEEEIQPIRAMDTLLNAPLHGSQQQEMVFFDAVGGFGEKTVMFSSEDACMEMTHSQTMLLSAYADVSSHTCDAFSPAADEKATNSSVLLFPRRHKDLSTEKKNTPALSFDPGFENFLLSLSTPPSSSSSSSSSSAAETNSSVALMKTQKANVDKEYLLPVSVMEKSLNTSRKAEEPGVRMSPAEDPTGPVLSDSDDENPFPFFFPSQESKDHSDKKRSKTTEKMATKSAPEDVVSSENPPLNPLHPRPKVNCDGGDRTVRFAADEEFMDMTRSHTVNISRGPVPPQQVEPGSLSKPTVRGVTPGVVPSAADMNRSVSTEGHSCRESSLGVEVCPDTDVTMELTEAQTGRIIGVHPFQFDVHEPRGETPKTTGGRKSKARGSMANYAGLLGQEVGEKTVRFSADDACMDMTQSHTVHIDSDVQPQTRSVPSCSDKTIRFDANDAGMDMTRCLTVKIDSNLGADSVLPEMKSVNRGPLRDRSSSSVPDADVSVDMETTEAQTGRILGITGDSFAGDPPSRDVSSLSGILKKEETVSGRRESSKRAGGLGFPLKPSLKVKQQKHQDQFNVEDEHRERTVRFSADDACMDATRSHTVLIDSDVQPQTRSVPSCSEKTIRFDVNDAGMDMTRCLTVKIDSNLGADSVLPEMKSVNRGPLRDRSSSSVPDVSVDMEMTEAHSGADVQLQTHGDKTVRFDANQAGMDMTRCLTVNIDNNLASDSALSPEKKPGSEKRVPPRDGSSWSAHGFGRTSVTAAPRSDTEDSPGGGAVCPDGDVSMDMTEAQTGRILGITPPPQDARSGGGNPRNTGSMPGRKESANRAGLRFSLAPSLSTNQPKQQENFDLREKTVRFWADDGCMDVTRSHTVHISSDLKLQPQLLSSCSEKTVRFDGNGAGMDLTRCLTVNIDNNVGSNSTVLPEKRQEVGVCAEGGVCTDLTEAQTGRVLGTSHPEEPDVSSQSPKATEAAADHREETLSLFPGDAVDSQAASDAVPARRESNITTSVSEPLCRDTSLQFSVKKRGRSLAGRSLGLGFKNSSCRTSGLWIDPVRTAAPDAPLEDLGTSGCLEVDTGTAAAGVATVATEKPERETTAYFDLSMDMTEAQTGRILGRSFRDELPQHRDSDAEVELLKQTEATSRQSQETADFNSPDSKEAESRRETTPSNQSDASQDVDASSSRKSRRISLADIQSKVRRLSRMINAAPYPDNVAAESCRLDDVEAAPLPPPAPEPNTNEEAQDESSGAEAPATPVPFNSKTKQLMSRLSMGAFKPKLPQISRPTTPKTRNSPGQETAPITANITKQLDHDVSDIFDEELDSVEDVSETPKKEEVHRQGADIHELLQEVAFDEDFISAVQGQKRPLPEDEIKMEDEKRLKASAEAADELVDMELWSDPVERDGNAPSGRSVSTLSSHTASVRHEATFESTLKQSTMFESQLEDYTCDQQKKIGEETLTVLEFLKVFNIDFVIHNPRQSILPGRISSESDQTLLDALRDRHIGRPKQLVYETDVLNLTERVEGLKVRLQDLDQPLLVVNKSLWEEMRNSSETELKSFGATLKQRNNIFRKTSRVLSHEMKEELYSNLVQANREEQQKLRGTIMEADEMIQSLDDCIGQLEAELTAVEEKGFRDKPSLKSQQEEMKKVAEALSETERQTSELDLQKQQNSAKVSRVKAETRKLQNDVAMLHMVNEWKLGENEENCSVYVFLHETVHLQLLYEKPAGDDAERKISQINFRLQLDDEKSGCHAHLVHRLLARHIESQTSWVEKYPTSRHVPKLLLDVGLVVSRCRLLGEELRLLKLWGGLRLDILHIGCVDTQVQVVFSSLEKLAKFEVFFSVCLTEGHCAVRVQSFKNRIGSTTIQQVEDIVASLGPSKNLLTKIIKKIHDGLLS